MQPGSTPRFIAQAHFLFDSVEAADIANYTTLQPIIQLNEVKM